jgi:hypothetical protein
MTQRRRPVVATTTGPADGIDQGIARSDSIIDAPQQSQFAWDDLSLWVAAPGDEQSKKPERRKLKARAKTSAVARGNRFLAPRRPQ